MKHVWPQAITCFWLYPEPEVQTLWYRGPEHYLTSVTVFTYGKKAYATHLKNVIVLQKKVLRVIAGVPPCTHTDNLFVQFDIFLVKKLYVCTIGVAMCKYDNGMLPELFCDMFTSINHIHGHGTGQAKSKNPFVSFKPTSRGQKSFTFSGPLV